MVAVIDGVLCRGVLRFAAGLQCLLFSATYGASEVVWAPWLWCAPIHLLISVLYLNQGSQTHLSMWAAVEDNSQSAGRTTKFNCFTQHCSQCS